MKSLLDVKKTIAIVFLLLISFVGYIKYEHWDQLGRSFYKYDDYLKLANDKSKLVSDFKMPNSMNGLYDMKYRGMIGGSETDDNLTINLDSFRIADLFCKVQKGRLLKSAAEKDLYYVELNCRRGTSGNYDWQREFFIEALGRHEENENVLLIHDLNKKPQYAYQVSKGNEFKKYRSKFDIDREKEENENNKKSFAIFCEQLPVIERVSSFFGRTRISSLCSCGFNKAKNTLTVSEMTKALSPSAGTIDPEVAKFSLESQLAIASCIEQVDVPSDKKDLTKDLADLLRSQVAVQKEMSNLK